MSVYAASSISINGVGTTVLIAGRTHWNTGALTLSEGSVIDGGGGGYPENSAAPGCASTVHFDYRSESSYSGQGGSLGGKKEYYESPACVFYNWLANLRRVL